MLLGLYGAAGCGKDTLANEILNYDSYERYRFADPLKNMLRQFHIPDNTWEDREAKEKIIPWLGVSPRYLAQTLGTEWGRELVNPDIWVILAKGRWHHINADGKGRMVIPDVRFANEAKWIKEAGGLVIQIVRSETLVIDNKGHAEDEHPLRPEFVDAAILNDGTVKEMYDKFWERVHVLVQ